MIGGGGGGGVSTLQPRQWWGRAWNAVADGVPPSAARAVQRGQALSRRGAVDELSIDPGSITANVAEDRGEDRQVRITCPVASDEVWERTLGVLADELRFTAALIEGELPEGIDEVLLGQGLQLVPTWDDLEVDCGCRERGPVCRHVAAVHAAAGVAIDRDPFLLFRLRGRDRRDLLAGLRERRGLPEAEVGESLDLSGGLSAARGDLEAIVLHPAPVDDPSGPFRHLGPPPGVDDDEPLIVLIERAAAAAWRLAAGDGSEAADEELLLAELRAQRVATPASLAEALGRDATELQQELDRLFSDGQVMRMGTGDRARYRASSGPIG